MPTAVASAMAPQISQSHVQQDLSPKSSYPGLPASKSNANSSPNSERRSPGSNAPNQPAPANPAEGSAQQPQQLTPDGKRLSPNSRSGHPPKIIVKKEPPSSPEASANARHRPHRLDLTSSKPSNAPGGMSSKPSGPLTAREGMVMHDVGLACLSPGFQTQDPTMQQQLQRSYTVREQQRHIIELRLQKSAKATDSDNGRSDPHHALGGGLRTSIPSSKKRSNPGLSIVPPSAEQFANERVVQSAPLNQTFTGRHQPHPLTRHVLPSGTHDSSHIHAPPQTANRLPPITDVFANEHIGMGRDGQPGRAYQQPPTSSHRPGFPSPGLQGPTSAAHQPSRPREYRSAEEAVAELTSGREELLPKLVHYGGHQPPTPPSPSAQHHGLTPNKHAHGPAGAYQEAPRSSSGRRRMRTEYERDNGSPPLGSGRSPRRQWGEHDSPDTNRRKKDEFLGLCARAWDLFHS